MDGVRALAIVAVMGLHGFVPHATGGFLGVDVFFVLSGFLITNLLLQEVRTSDRIRLGRFYLRRAVRLLPALVVLLVCFLLWSWASGRSSLAANVVPVLLYFANWAEAAHPDTLGPLSHTWSLSIEEQFYLAWPPLLLLLLGRKTSVRSLGIALIVAALSLGAWRLHLYAAGVSKPRLYYGLDTRGDALLVGCALACAFEAGALREFRARRARAILGGLLSGLALVAMAMVTRVDDSFFYAGGFTLVAFLAAGTLACVVALPDAAAVRWLGHPALVWVGRRSYGLYLWHYPVFYEIDRTWGWEPPILIASAKVALTTLAASASYAWVERPLLQWRARGRIESGATGISEVATSSMRSTSAATQYLPLGHVGSDFSTDSSSPRNRSASVDP